VGLLLYGYQQQYQGGNFVNMNTKESVFKRMRGWFAGNF
jgi:hypothetical protein